MSADTIAVPFGAVEMPGTRQTPEHWADGMKNTFTIGNVAGIVAVCVSITIGIYTATAGMRSDLRDIRTQMESRVALDAEKAKLADLRAEMLTNAVNDMKRRQELQQYEIQGLKEAIMNITAQLKEVTR